MIRGYRYRYVVIRDLFDRNTIEEIKKAFLRYFGEILFYEARFKFYRLNRPNSYVIRVTLERLDELLSVLYILRGVVVERISGTIKKLEELGYSLIEI